MVSKGAVTVSVLLENSSLAWLCLVALFAFAELFYLRYVALWGSLGSTVALILSVCCAPWWLQICSALISAIGLYLVSREWVRGVRCDDAMSQIKSEGCIDDDSVRIDRNLGDFGEDGASSPPMSKDDPSGDLFPQCAESDGVCTKAPYPLSLLDP